MNKLAYLLLLPLTAARNTGGSGASVADATLSIRPVKWSVIGGSSPREIVSGRTVPLTLQADIAKGWHIYSLTQKPGGPIPLRLELLGAADVVVRGVIKAPQPERAFDKNFGIETEVYSGSPRFTIPVGVAGRSHSGARKFQVGARYQVCSATLCLPARTDKLDVALRVTGRK
jgi:thiol:disulfide interchange protein DsbD